MAERPAGWYDDESDATWLRYWDGRGWTPHTAHKAAAPALAPGPVTAFVPAPASSVPAPTRFVPAPTRFVPTAAPTPPASGERGDELAQPLMQTMRLVPEHTTVPTPFGHAVASASPFATRPVRSDDRLPRGRVVLIVVAALIAGSLVVTLASSVAMLLLV
ncbi:DUF2510 domain-containing protein [Agromyces italicus]|uniref:DUF2510 domain-containing protein n=1 Tax=Agromyces italicus TaxID=279572 RepID=UPI0003B4F926|nr:DUF2510 domain-containing protein [Agromyces italicus]